jgi:hypothetical protein
MKNTDITSLDKSKNKISKLFTSLILLICSYQMDTNKNYLTRLDNDKVSEYLRKFNLNEEIIKYVKRNYDFNGKIIYLRNNVDSECMVFYTKKECELVFIGTQFDLKDITSLCKDIWTDICLGLESVDSDLLDSAIKMHSKYITNMNNGTLLNDIIKIIKKLNFKKINICGHSMGCGLGLYASIILTIKFPNVKFNLITFDSPKIGNDKLNNYVKKIKNLDHLDIINNNDVIPLFPFIYPNYLHIAKKTYILNNDGDINVCKDSNKQITIFTNHSINDHFTLTIIKNVYKCIISK